MFYNKLTLELEELKKKDNLRSLKDLDTLPLINFSSNDYLGLAKDIKLRERFFKETPMETLEFGSCGSRLLGGNYRDIVEFEKDIDKVFKRSSLVLNSGFDANTLVLETFYKKGDVIFTDRLNHASIYDGILHAGVKIVRYKHLDYKDLEKKLLKFRDLYKNALIITESIYSMDGDIVDLEKMVHLKEKYSTQLFLDEAHSYGVMGYGQGFNLNLVSSIDFIMLGLGKGGGSTGGILILDKIAKNYIINKGRKFIYTTAPSPSQTLWNRFIFNEIPKFKDRILYLEKLKNHLYKELKIAKIETSSSEQIVSIVIGNNKDTILIASLLQEKGYLLFPIKEPTVPKGSSRLRLTLTVDISLEDITLFVKNLKEKIQEVKGIKL